MCPRLMRWLPSWPPKNSCVRSASFNCSAVMSPRPRRIWPILSAIADPILSRIPSPDPHLVPALALPLAASIAGRTRPARRARVGRRRGGGGSAFLLADRGLAGEAHPVLGVDVDDL